MARSLSFLSRALLALTSAVTLAAASPSHVTRQDSGKVAYAHFIVRYFCAFLSMR